MARYTRQKVPGPLKSFLQGVGGFFLMLTLVMVFGALTEGPLLAGLIPILVFGGISGFFYALASRIPSKNQYTEK